ncbi:hypothetical protein [Sphingopyxis alaskensis]|uniref:hypothetical protein n=1 Tax=Sphingopyxis alaskensis TaxID=117207 RepID=UPI00203F503E|nr:hypothetical protein [Sphingopyxis alaskensis]MCM3420550.1 hypothetical protein [Sphingopyxis alaskensis]
MNAPIHKIAIFGNVAAPMHRRLKLHRNRKDGEVSIRGGRSKTIENSTSLENGTPIANDSPTGDAANIVHGRARGGARNRADRESIALNGNQVANLIHAARHATAIGLPLNRMITIHWEAAGVALDHMATATGKYLDLFTKALRRWGSAAAWLWVHEGGAGKGGHCHMLIHVPESLVAKVSGSQKKWLRRITGLPYRKGVIKSKPVGGLLGLETRNPDLHAVNLETVVGYLLKGADSDAIAEFELQRIEAGGRIVGKRCGTSQNIGPKARAAWGDGI